MAGTLREQPPLVDCRSTALIRRSPALALPRLRRSSPRQQTNSWAQNSKVLETVGSTGTNTCSPVGPGGYTGCETQVINEWRKQQRQSAEDNKPPQ